MATISEELYSLMVPLGTSRLIVPRSCVAEIVRFTLSEETDDADHWLRGKASWNGQTIPVISFERMAGMDVPEPGGRTRIVVFHPLSVGEVSQPYGILAEGFPQMLRVNNDVVETDPNYTPQADSPIVCQVRLLQEKAYIPDLEFLEQKLREAEVTN